MKEKIDKEVLIRYLKGEYTSKDKEYIENVFREENSQEELLKYLEEDWKSVRQSEELQEHDLEHILHALYYKIQHQPVKSKERKVVSIWHLYSRVAAVLLLPLVAAFMIYITREGTSNDSSRVSYAEINAPLGSRVNFYLPDGSNGWLNSGSRLKYPVKFGATREVELSGEAFFDIKKEAGRSFNVKANDLNISVLGTRFNVAAYEDDKKVDVVLESGKVRLNSIGSDTFIEMAPDERVVYDAANKEVVKSKVHSTKYSSWKEGKLVFRNDPIEEVARIMSRWYNVDIVIKEGQNSDLRLRATFEDEEIEEVMMLLKMTFPIDYEIEKRKKDAEGKFEKKKITITLNP